MASQQSILTAAYSGYSPSGLLSEIWKDIPGFNNYQASSLGRIRNRSGRIMRPWITGKNKCGYERICPRADRFSACRGMYIHDLVSLAFIGSKPVGYEVNHKNGKRLDNRSSNLEYVTHRQNVEHARSLDILKFKHLPVFYGSNNPVSRWTESDIIEMRRMRASGVSLKTIGNHFGWTKEGVWSVVSGRTWGWLPQPVMGCQIGKG